MKTRSGFVSNSSSSSFIIGVAGVTQPQLEELRKNKDLNLRQYLFDINDPRLDEYKRGDRIRVKSFDDTVVSVTVTQDAYSHFLILDSYGDEPDTDDDGYVEDADLDMFEQCDLDVYSIIDGLGGETSYGSGRDD